MANYPIPLSSKNAFESVLGSQARELNPGLVFERFVPDTQEVDQERGEETPKKLGMKQVIRASKQLDRKLLEAFCTRWLETVKLDHAVPCDLKTQWRFIAGLGRKGSLEVGFTFNRYGFPILPGSGVKGIARAAAITELAEALETDRLNALNECLSKEEDKEFSVEFGKQYARAEACRQTAQEFRAIFGSLARAGGAVFFDAIPDAGKPPELELDIMNPHYPNYYEGSQPPTDHQNPIPVYFLAVGKDTTFWFAVGWRGEDNPVLRQRAQDWLQYGLKNLGAGAKTSAGYGYFK